VIINSPLLLCAVNLHLVIDTGGAMAGRTRSNPGRIGQCEQDDEATRSRKADFQVFPHVVRAAERRRYATAAESEDGA
jgi:hypothetical protein